MYVRRTGKRCVWVLLDNWSEMERYDWSDFFAVLAVTYGTGICCSVYEKIGDMGGGC